MITTTWRILWMPASDTAAAAEPRTSTGASDAEQHHAAHDRGPRRAATRLMAA